VAPSSIFTGDTPFTTIRRLNELLGCVFDHRANVKMKTRGIRCPIELPISIHLSGIGT
jgi:hypothetical protein